MGDIRLLIYGRGGEIRTPDRLAPDQVPFPWATPRFRGELTPPPPGGQRRGAAALPKPCYGRVAAVNNSVLSVIGVLPDRLW